MYSKTDLRELEAWIHKHVMEADLYVGLKKRGLWYRPGAKGYTDIQSEAGRYTRAEAKLHEYRHDEPVTIHEFEPKHYTTDPAAAMEVLKICGQKYVNGTQFICLSFSPPGTSTMSEKGHWNVGRIKGGAWDGEIGSAESLELAICLFSRKLFTK